MTENTPEKALHWKEYGCELIGTMLLCFLGLSAVTFDFSKGLPMQTWIPANSPRLLITGLLFAGSGSLITISPLGKISGAHLNPSVTIAFWVQRKMHRIDVAGYILAQFLGAAIGCVALAGLWQGYAKNVGYGETLPGKPYSVWIAFIAELVLTWGYITLIFYFVSHKNLMRKTPLMNWLVIAVMVWLEAPISGTSLNSARSAGPALVSGNWTDQWVYFVAPPLGAILAGVGYPFLARGKHRILTGKLFHSDRYPSIFKNVPHPSHLGNND